MEPNPRERDGEETTFLARRGLQGDSQALGSLIARWTPLLYAQARAHIDIRLARERSSEDLVQEVWARTIDKLPSLRPRDGRLTPVVWKYLSSTLINLHNNLARRYLRGRLRQVDMDAEENARPALESLPAEVSGVLTRLLRTERFEILHDSLQRMDEMDRRVVSLRALDQLPNQEVALLLGMEPSTVSMRYTRALEKLRASLPDSLVAILEDL